MTTDLRGEPYAAELEKTREAAVTYAMTHRRAFAIIPITFHRGEGLE